MMNPISDNIVNAAIEYMNKYNTDYYRVLNCDELVFTMQDLNLTRDTDGKVVRKDGTPILMSWMINHQVLKTDVGDRAFRDPFVYADDAAVAETAEVSNIEQVKQSTNEKVKQVTATVEPKYEQPRQPSDEIATEESKKLLLQNYHSKIKLLLMMKLLLQVLLQNKVIRMYVKQMVNMLYYPIIVEYYRRCWVIKAYSPQ